MYLDSVKNLTVKIKKRGMTLIEILIVIIISAIIVGAALSLYIVVSKTYSQIKPLLTAKETTKTGLDQLEWFFQRWGFGVPCNNPANTLQCINIYVDNSSSNTFPYAPPSSLYIRIRNSDPCDEVWFYGSLEGEGFVTRIVGTDRVAVMSCRLSDENNQNCYHIWRGTIHRYNSNSSIDLDEPTQTGYADIFDLSVNPNKEFPIIFEISNLSEDNLDCSRETNPDNAEMSIIATAHGSAAMEDYNGTQQILTPHFILEGQDLLIRVPHLIHLFCQNNPQDNNNLWLYIETFDVSYNCNADEPSRAIVRVNRFQVTPQNNGVLVTLEMVSDENTVVRVERFYGR